MRPRLIALVAALSATSASAASPVEGQWLVESGNAKVTIAPCAGAPGRLCGTVTWLRSPSDSEGRPARDVNNPDPKLRTRSILGSIMIHGFKPAGANRWNGGKIYDPDSGKTYDAKLQLESAGVLKLDGCVLMICRSQRWKRA